MSLRIYQDPLHGGITLDSDIPEEAMIMALIDAEPFQRLRRIRQLGPAFLTFHGAESSRFTHSLGVFDLARRALKKLLFCDPELKSSKGLIYASALLHDLGHGPLSHTGEGMFGILHETWSARLTREHPEIFKPLEAYKKGTAESVANLLENGHADRNVAKALVSSQLDCDRLDYLIRDSYSTGAKYGQLDIDRILSAITLSPDGELAIHPKGLMAIEHYLLVRSLMYRSVYNHRINEVCNWILEQIVRTASQLNPEELWADQFMAKWLWEPKQIDISTFLANDDIRTGYHLMRWAEEAPSHLSLLCKRFLNRHLLKAIEVNHLSRENQLELLAQARLLAEKQGQDPSYCCGLRHNKLHGYLPYKGGLRLWDGKDLKALEQVSPLVSSLIEPTDSSWLIHPREIHHQLLNTISDFKTSICI